MAQVTTGELSGLAMLVCTSGITILGFFVKKWIDGIDQKIDQFAKSQNECRLTLPEKYVLKHDCEKDMAVNSASILKIAGKLNGGSLHHDSGH